MRRLAAAVAAAAVCALDGRAASAQAPAASTSTITLEQVLALARRDNPEILAARKTWEAAEKRASQEATPDKPRVDIERKFAPAGSSVVDDAREKSVAVTQEIPFPTTLYLRRGKARKEAGIAEQEFRAKTLEVAAKTSAAYAKLFFSCQGVDTFAENIEIMRRFSKVAEARYAAGRSSQLDALKAQVELTRMLNLHAEFEQDRQEDEARLDALLGRDAREPLGRPEDPRPRALNLRLDDLEASAGALRPELRAAVLEDERAAKNLSLARSEYLPDFMLQYRWRDDSMNGRSNDAMVGFSVPLWFWKPAAMVSQAKAEEAASEARLKALRVGTSADVKTAWLRAELARSLAEVYRTSLLPQAQETLAVAESGYQTNNNGFLDLLDAQRSLLGAKLEYYRYLADYELRLAELERAVGKELKTP